MIEGFLGEDRFRDGIRLYMRAHREANATADDLWGALGEASAQPILELANGVDPADRLPAGDVALAADGRRGAVDAAQRRFFADPDAAAAVRDAAATRWPVPVVLRFQDANGRARSSRCCCATSRRA